MNLLKTLYDTNSSRDIKRGAAFKIWLRENSRTIMPFVTFAIGVLAGIGIWWGFAQVQISQETATYRAQTISLETRIAELEGDRQQNLAGFSTQMAQKDSVISRLKTQKQTLASLITFTRRFTRTAQIMPESQQESDYFRRNTLYLISEFNKQQEALTALDDEPDKEYNLQTIPQLMTSETAELAPDQL